MKDEKEGDKENEQNLPVIDFSKLYKGKGTSILLLATLWEAERTGWCYDKKAEVFRHAKDHAGIEGWEPVWYELLNRLLGRKHVMHDEKDGYVLTDEGRSTINEILQNGGFFIHQNEVAGDQGRGDFPEEERANQKELIIPRNGTIPSSGIGETAIELRERDYETEEEPSCVTMSPSEGSHYMRPARNRNEILRLCLKMIFQDVFFYGHNFNNLENQYPAGFFLHKYRKCCIVELYDTKPVVSRTCLLFTEAAGSESQ